jgi:peroxiredoxin Q/BCP
MAKRKGPPSSGESAPDFSLASDSGKNVSLGDYRGKTLVLYFYPKDSTPGCTREAQAFEAAKAKLAKMGAAVVGVSKDSVKSHCSFRDKYDLSFPLLSDPDLKTHEAYGVYGEKMMYGKKILGTIRSTFVIDGKGKIAHVWSPVKVDGHADAVMEVVKSLG